jgi:hypothetical protein
MYTGTTPHQYSDVAARLRTELRVLFRRLPFSLRPTVALVLSTHYSVLIEALSMKLHEGQVLTFHRP